MVTFLNHVAIAAPRNGTTTHTVDPSSGTVVAGAAFTPTAGRLLVCVVEGAVTSSTPSGWTLPAGGSAVNMTGLYVWHRTAAGGDSLTTTHNSSNYPVVFDFYEFAAGSTFRSAASSTGVGSGAAGPTLGSLPGTATWIGYTFGGVRTATSGTGSIAWGTGVEEVDTSVNFASTDGYLYSLAVNEDFTGTSTSSTATVTDNGSWTYERITFAVNAVAGGSSPNTGTGSGAWGFVGTGAGKRAPQAAGAGTFTFTGTGSAQRTPKATGNGTWGFAGAGTGKRTPKATGAGSWTFVGTGVGEAVDPDVSTGAGSGVWSFTGEGVGKRNPVAAGSGAWAFEGSGAAVAVDPDVATGQGSGVWSFIGSGVGHRSPVATGAGTWGFVGAGTTLVRHPPPRARTLVVPTDPRTLVVPAQPRTLVVPADPRTLTG